MLNKLSFNLAKELNESETRKFKIKKRVFMESNGVREEVLTEGENTFKYSFTPDEIKKILLDNYHDGEGFESETELEQHLDEELNNIKRIESESDISMISQPGNDSFPGFKYGKVRTVLKDGRTFISEENGLSLMSAVELSVSKLEEAASMSSNSKEDRLASLKMQLEKDGAQLADDEKKAIEEEIAQLESELEECDKPLKEDEEVDQSTMLNTIYNYYRDYMSDLAFIEDFVNCIDDYEGFVKFAEAATQDEGIGNSAPDDILSEVLDAYDDINMFFDDSLNFLDYNKVKEWYDSLEINESALKEDDYSLARPWSTALINYCENYGVDVWEEELRGLINYLPDDTIGKYIKDMNPNGVSKPEDFYPGEIDESALNERYVEKFGGDSEDFVNDVNVIKSALEAIDTDSFGAKLSQQMVWDWIETCDYQIERGNRLTKGEFNESALNEADGWIAFYNGNKVEITKDEAHDLWSAKQVAIKKLNVPKSKVSLVAVEPAYNECEKKPIVEAAETEVKDLQVIKEQGNVYMLEDKSEGTRYIVGENYNLSEGEIENAEIYESKEEADKDYLNRCEITTTDKSAE